MSTAPPEATPNDAPLTLVTLGGWGLHASPGSPAAPLLGPSKSTALIVYLALSPGRAAQREHLLDLLWADLEPTAATHAFRQTVWYVRRRLGDRALKAGGNQLALTAPVTTDRDQFLAAVERQDWERSVALYTGDFLPGFAAPGGAEFERWADLERWRLRGLFARAAEALTRRLLAAADPVGAAVEADALERQLHEDDREPEPATRTLLRLARQQPGDATADTSPGPLVAELVGREKEFGAIVAAWDAVRRGASRHIHVTAGAGLGKSRLLADAQRRLRASGARTLLVRAAPGERTLSYALAADLADALAGLGGAAAVSAAAAGTLVGLGPALAARYPNAQPDRAADDELLRRRVLALAELLAAVADEAPLALLLDDVHWMDTHSRQLVAALLGRLSRIAVLVVTTARPGPEGALDGAATEALTLEPLTTAQFGALLFSFGPLPDVEWAADLPAGLRAASDGSPLLALETLELAIERGILALDAGGWTCPAPGELRTLLDGGAALTQRLERLTGDQRWLLLLLAVHGTPLPREQLLAAAPRTEDALHADLLVLEQRGLVQRGNAAYQPAHDAIAEAAAQLALPDAITAAHGALARSLAPQPDGATLPRIAQHFAAAGEARALDAIYRRWIRVARSHGDRRNLRALARELLGSDANGRLAALVRGLPLHLRLGLTTPGRVAAAALAVVVIGAGAAWTASRRHEVAVRVIGLLADGDGVRPIQIAVSDEDLQTVDSINIGTGTRVPQLPARITPRPIGVAYLGAGVWSSYADTPGPDGEEPVFYGAAGDAKYPPKPGDDIATSASPDGRFVAVYTDRWSSENAGDVGVFDLTAGSLRQLTSGPERDTPGPWSPDGTRIAFERRHYDNQPDELCWVTFDGARHACFAPSDWHEQRIVGGWTTTHEILVLGIDRAGHSSVYSVNLDTKESRRLFAASDAAAATGSPWIVISAVSPSGETALELRRADAPGRAIRLTGGNALASLPILAPGVTSGQAPRYLERLSIMGPLGGGVAPGVPFQLRATGLAADGGSVAVPVVEWSVRDTTVARVDRDGIQIGRRNGAATVYASAGGWRVDSATVHVETRGARTALAEAWDASWNSRWQAFGIPIPRSVLTAEGAALFVSGDSSFYSGVYSRRAFAADSGLGIGARVSTPSPVGKWQILHLAFYPLSDSVALRGWDQRTGAIPLTTHDNAEGCDAGYPAGEAAWAKDFISLTAGSEGVYLPVSRALASGRPWEWTLQILPDGRCAVALDGKVLGISSAHLTPGVPRHVLVDGQSIRTTILVGPLQVWQGVRSGTDWTGTARVRVH